MGTSVPIPLYIHTFLDVKGFTSGQFARNRASAGLPRGRAKPLSHLPFLSYYPKYPYMYVCVSGFEFFCA